MATNDPTLVIPNPEAEQSFLGIRNKKQSRVQPIGSMESATNVNINGISIERRNGFALSQAFTNIQGVYQTIDESALYIVDNGTLKLVNDDLSAVSIISGFDGSPVYFSEVGNQVFYSSNIKGSIKGISAYPYIDTAAQPTVSVVDGTLPAGRYMITATYTRADGAEGGAPPASVVEVDDNSALLISAVAPANHTVNIYVSSTNGSDLYHVYSGVTAIIQWDNISELSYPLDINQYQTDPLPSSCGVIEYHEGKIWAADYSIDLDITAVRFSKPYWFHLYDLYGDYIPIPGKVEMLSSTASGILIGTDKEIYVYTAEESLVKLADYGVVAGYPAAKKKDGKVLFWTQRGACEALPFRNITESKVSFAPGYSCSTSVMRENGEERFLVLTDGNGSADNSY